jgi:glucose/arabinose dehydrogenase
MKKFLHLFFAALVVINLGLLQACASEGDKNKKAAVSTKVADDAGLKLPGGFSAVVVADNLGKARHIVVTKQGDVYAKINARGEGKGIVKLRDTDGDGKADQVSSFGTYGGTGIAIKNGYLYASSDEEVFRYKLDDKGDVINPAQPEKIITGLLNRRQHESKSITLDDAGNIYVNIGAYSNSCQEKDRAPGSMGRMPCPILDSAGGIWQFRADKLNQTYGDGVRYATGLRNVVGLDWNSQANQLFVMQHGRDDLHTLFPSLFTDQDNAEKPAEVMFALKKGDNGGWPYIYHDPATGKKMQAPEYGGDGKKESDKNFTDPVAMFPAHLAPNAMMFYTGNMFPAKYKNGAFIAFHGSWNRAPLPQEGYYVVFMPFENGKPSGKWEIFANGFAVVENITPRSAVHRPCGLAQGPDGALYVSDDQKGTIYKITYNK